MGAAWGILGGTFVDFRIPFGEPFGHWLSVFASAFWGPYLGALRGSILERFGMMLGVMFVHFGVLFGEELETRKTVFGLHRRERIAFGASWHVI